MRSALECARASGLLSAGQRVLVLLSGGSDSVCLLDVAVEICGADSVAALHVNYGLRPSAERDERCCRELCERLNVALTVHEAPVAPERGNLQDWARNERYQAAHELAEQDDALIAVAHTASDRVETVLYRLAASPGRRALLAMRPREGCVVRPLLEVWHEQVIAYCRERKLVWCEDETNVSARYARNRVRHELVPALEQVHPVATRNVLRTAEILAEEAEVLDELVDKLIAGRERLPCEWLADQPVALRRLLVRELAERTLARGFAAAGRRCDELIELGVQPGKRTVDLGDGVRALLKRGELSFERLSPGGSTS